MNDGLRILFVGAGDYRSPDEKQALGSAQELLRRGHAVMTSFLGDPALIAAEGADRIDGLHARTHDLRPLGRLRPEDVAAACAFAPHIVHVLGARVAAAAAARELAATTQARLLVHLADDEWGLMRRGTAARALRRAAWRLHPTAWPHTTARTLAALRREAAAFDALAPELAAHARQRLGRDVAVVLPVLPELPPAGERDELPALPSGPLVAYTGAIAPAHVGDVLILLRAIALLRREGRPIRLLHAGSVFVDAGELLRTAGLDADAVTFLGHVPPPALTGLLARADVLAQPGAPTEFNRLRLPSKLQAYLPSGTPTVTFACGFGAELADEDEVLKTHTAAPEELARQVVRLLDDTALAERIAAGGRRAAARLFDPVRNTDDLERYYRTALASTLPGEG